MDNDVVKKIYDQTQMIIGWYADKYKAMIFRPATMNKDGCRTWEKMGINIFAFGIYLEIDIQPQKIHK
jgi:hypothetical protein